MVTSLPEISSATHVMSDDPVDKPGCTDRPTKHLQVSVGPKLQDLHHVVMEEKAHKDQGNNPELIHEPLVDSPDDIHKGGLEIRKEIYQSITSLNSRFMRTSSSSGRGGF